MRTEQEIDDVLGMCIDSYNNGASRYPGMTYEQGIEAAIEWMRGNGEHPFE